MFSYQPGVNYEGSANQDQRYVVASREETRYQPTTTYQNVSKPNTQYQERVLTTGQSNPQNYGRAEPYSPSPNYRDVRNTTPPKGTGAGGYNEKVVLVDSNPDYKVYQYRSVIRESTVISHGDDNRRVVTGDRYSDGTPVKQSKYINENSPDVPFNPRRSKPYSNSKYVTVVRDGREIKEEILDY